MATGLSRFLKSGIGILPVRESERRRILNFDYLQERLNDLGDQHRRRQLVPRLQQGTRIVGPDGRELVNFGGNDYLGLAAENVTRSSESAATGSQASALVCGWTTEHQRLADAVAQFESTEAAVIFPSGFAACSGTIATLAEAGDLILSDQLNHASLIDGCRLSPAQCHVYPHRDVAAVEKILAQQRGQYKRVWIVTDSVFSMDGHIAPLVELCDLAEKYDAVLIVDEAHGTGVLGDCGSGLCEALGVKSKVPIRIGTFSKAIGSQGGFVAGPNVVIDYLINRCRSLIYSTSLAPAAVRAALAAIEVINNQPDRRELLGCLTSQVRERLSITSEPIERLVPIIPVMVKEDSAVMALSGKLQDAGLFVPAIRPPTVPPGPARLRISLSAAHQQADIDRLLDLLTG